MSVRPVWNLKLILVVALVLRIGAAVAVEQHVQKAGRRFLIEGDANGYWELGTRIASGQDYALHHPPRYVLRTPGFPLLLATSIGLFGDHVLPARVLLAGIGTACCGLTFLLGQQWLGRHAGLMAAGIMAVSPLHVGNSVLILSETTFALGALCCLLIFSRMLRPAACLGTETSSKVLFMAFAVGLATGVTVLIRPGWILWVGVSGGSALLFLRHAAGLRFAAALAIGLGCTAALFPWAYRNHTVTGHWVFTSLWSGASLYDGLHPGATGASDMTFVDEQSVLADMSEYEANAHYKRLALEYAVQNPGRTVQLAMIKAGRYLSWVPNASGFSNTPLYLVCLIFYGCFFSAVLMGVWKLRMQLPLLTVMLSPFLQFLLVHMVFVGSVRYRLPVEYSLAILAAAGCGMANLKFGREGADVGGPRSAARYA